MQRGILFAALVCSFAAFAGDWKPFDTAEFTASFHGEVKTSSRTDDTQIGQVKSSVYSFENDHEAFTLSITDYPPELVSKSLPTKMLEGARDGAVANVGGTLDKDIGIFIDSGLPKKKWPGREFTLHTGQGLMMNSRVYLVANKLFTLLMVRDGTVKDDADFVKFAESLKLKPPPAAPAPAKAPKK